MNVHEERAWRLLRTLGAKETSIGGKHALDLSPIRVTSAKKLGLLVQAAIDVVGRSGANRRHVDRRGCPIYVVTDFYTVDQTDGTRHAPELTALLARHRAGQELSQVSETTPMQGVREHAEQLPVQLELLAPRPEAPSEGPRYAVAALNEGGRSNTRVDLLDMLAWLHTHRPDLLATAEALAHHEVLDTVPPVTPERSAILARCFRIGLGELQARVVRGDEDAHLPEMLDAFDAYFAVSRAKLGHDRVPIVAWETYAMIKNRCARSRQGHPDQ